MNGIPLYNFSVFCTYKIKKDIYRSFSNIPIMVKNARMELRMTKEEKASIKKLASEKGMSIGRYLVWKALHEDAYFKEKARITSN